MNAVSVISSTTIANVEAEAALCGALMSENGLIDAIADKLSPEDFHEAVFGRIFSVIVRERSLGRPATPVTLRPYFADDEAMRELGGPGFLAQLTGSGVVVIGAKGYADQVLDLARRRRLMEGLQAVVNSQSADIPLDELVSAVEEAVAKVGDHEEGSKEMSAADAIGAHLDQVEQGLPPGVTSGIDPIDQAFGPIRSGDLGILAGRPGMFKTGTALNIARGAAQKGHGVLFVSLEMKAEQLGMRLAADLCFNGHSGINFTNIEQGTLTNEQFRELHRARERIRDLPLVIADLPSLRPGQFARLVRRHKRRFAARGQKLELVIVDYLQLMDSDRSSDSRTTEITQVSRGLKMAAKANDVGVLALAQLSRKVEEREEKRPRLADIRESGSIEQDADSVIFLYRPEYYLLQIEPPETSERREKWEAALQKCQGDIEFICAKRRQGQTGIRHGRYYGCFQAVR